MYYYYELIKNLNCLITEKEALKALKPDKVSSWTLVLAFFVLVFNFVLLETLATSLTMDQFAWSKRQALEYMGALMSVGAVVACITFAMIGPLTKIFEERYVTIYFLIFVCLVTLSRLNRWTEEEPTLFVEITDIQAGVVAGKK